VQKTTKIVLATVGVAAVAVVGWKVLPRREAAGGRVLTAAVDRGTVIQSVSTTGTLSAVTTVKVGSQVSGIIASLHADFNDRVRRGQVLATLDPTPFEAAVNQTKAQLERARIGALDAEAKLKRQKALFAANLTSQDQLDSAQAVYDQAVAQVSELEAALERATTNLRYSVITSPIDGVVVSRDYDVGQTVAASFQAPTLFTIAEDLTRMQLACDVDEADIGQVKLGQPVRFSVDSYPEREFSGQVAQIRLSPKVANNVVTYPVIVEVENPDLALLPGMTAEVHIQVAQAVDVLRVPAAALRFRPELLGSNGQRPGARSGGERQGNGAGGERRPQALGTSRARVYLSPTSDGTRLQAVDFLPGLTDGQYVEVREGPLAEGNLVAVGLATATSQEVGGIAGMSPFGRRR